MADDAQSTVSSSRPPSPSTPTNDTESIAPLPSRRTAPGPYRFHWDPTASKRQGPPSISDATESRADVASIDASIPPPKIESIFDSSLGSSSALPVTWSSSQNGFNAISTVLNNPHSRPNALKSNRAPIFTGPSPDLPRIRRKDFDPYLKAVGPEWARFERNQQQARAKALEQEGSQSEAFSPSDGDSAPTPPPKKGAPPPLDTVPRVYFEADFDLGTPRTFALVSERRVEDGPGPSEEDPTVNHDLQDRLSGYLDVVEQHLTIEIQARSSSFFAALSNLHSLQAEGAECITRISHLRKQLVDVDEKQAKRGLQITRLLKRKDNVHIVQEGVQSIQAVGESVGLVRGLVATGGYFEALAMIDQLEHMFEKPPTDGTTTSSTNTFPLASIIALESLPGSLRELATSIASSLSADLVALLRADLMRDDDTAISAESTTALQERISPLLHALVRTSGVEVAVLAYQEVVLAEIKSCVRKHLPPSEWEDEDLGGGAESAALSKRDSLNRSTDVKALSHEEFMKLGQTMFSTLLSRLHTVSSHITSVTTVITSFATSNNDPPSPTLLTLLNTATELANARSSKVLALRSSVHAQLPLASFMQVFHLAWDFVIKCEVLTRRMIVGLRGVVVGQAKGWLTSFHADRTTKAARAVEEETWTQVEVSAHSQGIVDLIVAAAMGDPKELVITGEDLAATATTNGNGNATNAKLLKVDDHPYFLVAATSEVLELLLDYLRVVVNLQLLTTDAMGRIIEYLKAFNSRTCQVVLGAGAMRSAGLKNITAKHLALASQSLSVMIALVPYIRETLRRHLNPKQAVILVEFDKLKRDYQEHQNEIHSKLIAIMGDRLSVHCRSLQDIQWDLPPAKAGPNTYMEVLVKETVVLHKVLSKYLAEQSVEVIMTQVFAGINHRLSEEFGKIELPSQEAKTRMLQDAKYLHDRLSSLKGVNLPGSMLETVVMEKTVPRKGSPFPMRRTSTLPQQHNSPSRNGSGLGSPLANGSGSPRGSRPGTPTMHALLAAGAASPSPMPTPPIGRAGGGDTPTSPMVSPRLFPSDAKIPQSPSQWPSTPLPQIVQSPPPFDGVASPPLSPSPMMKPPPTPPKDRTYLPIGGVGLGLGNIEAEDVPNGTGPAKPVVDLTEDDTHVNGDV